MKVGVIEIYSHHLFVVTITKLLAYLDHDVTLFLSRDIYSKVEPLLAADGIDVSYCVQDAGESQLLFLIRSKRVIDSNLDLVCINSVQGYRVLYFFLVRFKTTTIAAAGRVSEFFGNAYGIDGLTTIRQVVHHNISKFVIDRLVPGFEGLIFHSSRALRLAEDAGFRGKTCVLPFSLGEQIQASSDSCSSGSRHFVVTGSITERARDYFMVLDVFLSLWQEGYTDIELTILASPRTRYGHAVARRMEELQSLGYPIRFYRGWISEEEYAAVASDGQVLIAPIRRSYYGLGEITSVEVEVVRSGKPAIFPSWYHLGDQKPFSDLTYGCSSELKEVILKCVREPGFLEECTRHAGAFAARHCLEVVAPAMQNFIKEIQ